jgi:hypothetical protein
VIDPQRLPEPEQIHAWLSAHGWTPESPLPDDAEDGVLFTFRERADDGSEITVIVPNARRAGYYPARVRDVLVTAAGFGSRPEAEVYEEMLAIRPRATVA